MQKYEEIIEEKFTPIIDNLVIDDITIDYGKIQPNQQQYWLFIIITKYSYTKEEDQFLAYCLYKYGYGTWELYRFEIENSRRFLFDWKFVMRPGAELQRRCEYLITCFKREIEKTKRKIKENQAASILECVKTRSKKKASKTSGKKVRLKLNKAKAKSKNKNKKKKVQEVEEVVPDEQEEVKLNGVAEYEDLDGSQEPQDSNGVYEEEKSPSRELPIEEESQESELEEEDNEEDYVPEKHRVVIPRKSRRGN